jgi:hypothetical protein
MSASTFEVSMRFRYCTVADSAVGISSTGDAVSMGIEVSANERLVEGVAEWFVAKLVSFCSSQWLYVG